MRIYVASKFENTAEVWSVMDRLRGMGHVITHDWTREALGDRTGAEAEAYLVDCAQKDMAGVETADAVFVINHPAGKGMWTELGMALAWQIPVFFVCPERAMNIFTHLPGVETFTSIDEGIAGLEAYGKVVNEARGVGPA